MLRGPWFQPSFGCIFLRNSLILTDIVPLDFLENSKLFTCETLWIPVQFWSNFLRDTLGLSDILPLNSLENSMQFTYATLWICHSSSKVRQWQMPRSHVQSWRFQSSFCHNFLRDILGVSEVVPLDWEENSKLFSCKTLWKWPNGFGKNSSYYVLTYVCPNNRASKTTPLWPTTLQNLTISSKVSFLAKETSRDQTS